MTETAPQLRARLDAAYRLTRAHPAFNELPIPVKQELLELLKVEGPSPLDKARKENLWLRDKLREVREEYAKYRHRNNHTSFIMD